MCTSRVHTCFSVPVSVFCASQVLGVNLLREDTVRKRYPESYKDCGTNDDEQCPEGYPGAQQGSKEWNEVMKFTSAVKMFGKSARKKLGLTRDKKVEAAIGAPSSGSSCESGFYAEAAAAKPSKVPDIKLKGKRYTCKGGARMRPPAPTPPTLTIVAATFARARVPTVPFKSVPRGVPTRAFNKEPPGGLLQIVPEVRGVSSESKLRRGTNAGWAEGD